MKRAGGFSVMALRLATLALFIGLTSFSVSGVVYADETTVKLKVGGTGTALGGMRLLAKVFNASHPKVQVEVLPSLGSGGGIKALIAGKIDLSLSARPLKKRELGKGISASLYARTPIIFASHQETEAKEITLEQVIGIYSSVSPKWPDGKPLRLILRPPMESDIKLLRSFSPGMDKAVGVALTRSKLYTAVNDQDNAAALEKVPGSLGTTTLAQIKSERRKIKPLSFNGLEGTYEALKAGKYPYFKKLYVVGKTETKASVKTFLEFMQSPQAKAILSSNGHVVSD